MIRGESKCAAAAVAIPHLMVVLAIAGHARAVDQGWTNSAGGTFGDPANWSGGVAPGTSDNAVFNLASAYGVDFAADAHTAALIVNAGDVTFDLNGHTYQLGSGNNFGSIQFTQASTQVAHFTLVDGTLLGRNAAIAGNLTGMTPLQTGTAVVTVSTGGHLEVNSTSLPTIDVGTADSNGTLNVINGGTVKTFNMRVANGLSIGGGSSGVVDVSGAGSLVQADFDIDLGLQDGGVASMRVGAGGRLQALRLSVGASAGSTASFLAEGVGTHVDLNALFVGASGTGQEMTVRDGATLSLTPGWQGSGTQGDIFLGYYNGGQGRLTVTGAGTTVTAARDLQVGILGEPGNPGDRSTGTFRVVGGGPQISIGRNLTMGVDDAALAAVIDDTGLATTHVAGVGSLQGRMEVELASGVTPADGSRYDVFTAAGGITGRLTLAGPDAGRFTIEQTDAGKTLSLVYIGGSPFLAVDATGDLGVDQLDLAPLAAHYDQSNVGFGRSGGDFNNDGSVDLSDLLALQSFYGQGALSETLVPFNEAIASYPVLQAALPEPSCAGGLIAMALLSTMRRRRRRAAEVV